MHRLHATVAALLPALVGCTAATPTTSDGAAADPGASGTRPELDRRVYEVFGDDDGHGMVFLTRPRARRYDDFTARRETSGGETLWTHTTPPYTGNVEVESWPYVAGRSFVVGTSSTREFPSDGALHIGADGAVHAWASPSPSAGYHAAFGDASQVFAIWHGVFPRTGGWTPLVVAAYDPATGARTWTAESRAPDWAFIEYRIDERWILLGHPYADWQALRRTDGTRVPLPPLTSDLCRAAGRWWSSADDRLVTIDLTGDAPVQRDVPATFIPPELAHQWEIEGCAARGDEVILLVNVVPRDEGMIVGVDPNTLATRWTLTIPETFATHEEAGFSPWSVQLGKVAVVPTISRPCAVDLDEHRLLWCVAQDYSARVHLDGEDAVIRVTPLFFAGLLYVRMRGADGKFTAATYIDGDIITRGARNGMDRVRGGRLWLAFDAETLGVRTGLPLLVLDARTLQLVDPTAPGRIDMRARARDVLADVEEKFKRTEAPEGRSEVSLRAVNPWDERITGAPLAKRAPRPVRPVEHHDAIFAVARTQAGLAADTEIRVLGWRGDLVVAYAEERRDDVTTWTLVWGTGLELADVDTRTFTRRPTALDIDRFVLASHPLGLWDYDSPDEPRAAKQAASGVTDEKAWKDLTGAPRDPGADLWQMP